MTEDTQTLGKGNGEMVRRPQPQISPYTLSEGDLESQTRGMCHTVITFVKTGTMFYFENN